MKISGKREDMQEIRTNSFGNLTLFASMSEVLGADASEWVLVLERLGLWLRPSSPSSMVWATCSTSPAKGSSSPILSVSVERGEEEDVSGELGTSGQQAAAAAAEL
jgi:hypothetical protein